MDSPATPNTKAFPAPSDDRLISSDRIEGTDVYDLQGERLGTVSSFMVDKFTGRVAYAVMSFGGFLGLGEHHHPLPWSVLIYDPAKAGYVVNLDHRCLEAAPRYSPAERPEWSDRAYGRGIDIFYGVPAYWGLY